MTYLLPKIFLPTVFSVYVVSAAGGVWAQDIQTALRDYERGRMQNVREALILLKDTAYNKPEYLFLDAVFEEDGERAFELYSELSTSVSDDPIYEQTLWRMCQYNYAKGLYDTCSENLKEFIKIFPESGIRKTAQQMHNRVAYHLGKETQSIQPYSEEPAALFTVQFGAFGTESRARRHLAFLHDLGITQSYIREQRVGSRLLYKIWAGEFTSKEEARKRRDAIKRQYRISDLFITEKK